MAHAFKIVDTSGVVTTYTDYDDIPLSTLRHVISFLPDIGTEEQANEILLEPESTVTDNVATEDEVGLETVIVTDADDNLIMEIADGVDRLVPEDFADGLENHLVLELVEGDNHIGPFVRLETGTTDVLLDEDGGRIPFDRRCGRCESSSSASRRLSC